MIELEDSFVPLVYQPTSSISHIHRTSTTISSDNYIPYYLLSYLFESCYKFTTIKSTLLEIKKARYETPPRWYEKWDKIVDCTLFFLWDTNNYQEKLVYLKNNKYFCKVKLKTKDIDRIIKQCIWTPVITTKSLVLLQKARLILLQWYENKASFKMWKILK